MHYVKVWVVMMVVVVVVEVMVSGGGGKWCWCQWQKSQLCRVVVYVSVPYSRHLAVCSGCHFVVFAQTSIPSISFSLGIAIPLLLIAR